MYACVHVCMYACTLLWVFTCVTNIHTCVCAHIHTTTRPHVPMCYAPGTYRAGAHVRVISRPFPALRGRSNAANCAHSHTAMMMMMSAAKQVRQHTVHMPRRQRTVARGRGVGMPKHAASRAAHDSRRARGDSGPPVRRRALHMEIPGSHDPNKCAHVCGSDACTRARVRAP